MTQFRSYLFAILLMASAVITTLIGFPTFVKKEWALKGTQLYGALVLWLAKVVCGLDHRVEGRGNIPLGPVLFASNHQSMWETFALASELEKPCFVLKKELLRMPIFGWWFAAAGFIAIDREAGANAMRQMLETAQARVADGFQIVIFPEGTRVKPGETVPYHPGVAGLYRALGVPCVPTAHNSGLFWHDPGITRLPGTITLAFSQPIAPGLKRAEFLTRLKDEIDTSATAFSKLEAVPAPE